jgi:hypothetical protein
MTISGVIAGFVTGVTVILTSLIILFMGAKRDAEEYDRKIRQRGKKK